MNKVLIIFLIGLLILILCILYSKYSKREGFSTDPSQTNFQYITGKSYQGSQSLDWDGFNCYAAENTGTTCSRDLLLHRKELGSACVSVFSPSSLCDRSCGSSSGDREGGHRSRWSSL